MISLRPRTSDSFTIGLWRSSLYFLLPVRLRTAMRAVGVAPNFLVPKMEPKKWRSFFLGLDRSRAHAMSLPFSRTLNGCFLPSAASMKPVTLPIPLHGKLVVSGQSGGGVFFVLPSVFTLAAPADQGEAADTPTIAAKSAANASRWHTGRIAGPAMRGHRLGSAPDDGSRRAQRRPLRQGFRRDAAIRPCRTRAGRFGRGRGRARGDRGAVRGGAGRHRARAGHRHVPAAALRGGAVSGVLDRPLREQAAAVAG